MKEKSFVCYIPLHEIYNSRYASNIRLVTFVIEIGFADSFDSQIFSMNTKLRAKGEMITRELPRIERHSGGDEQDRV